MIDTKLNLQLALPERAPAGAEASDEVEPGVFADVLAWVDTVLKPEPSSAALSLEGTPLQAPPALDAEAPQGLAETPGEELAPPQVAVQPAEATLQAAPDHAEEAPLPDATPVWPQRAQLQYASPLRYAQTSHPSPVPPPPEADWEDSSGLRFLGSMAHAPLSTGPMLGREAYAAAPGTPLPQADTSPYGRPPVPEGTAPLQATSLTSPSAEPATPPEAVSRLAAEPAPKVLEGPRTAGEPAPQEAAGRLDKAPPQAAPASHAEVPATVQITASSVLQAAVIPPVAAPVDAELGEASAELPEAEAPTFPAADKPLSEGRVIAQRFLDASHPSPSPAPSPETPKLTAAWAQRLQSQSFQADAPARFSILHPQWGRMQLEMALQAQSLELAVQVEAQPAQRELRAGRLALSERLSKHGVALKRMRVQLLGEDADHLVNAVTSKEGTSDAY